MSASNSWPMNFEKLLGISLLTGMCKLDSTLPLDANHIELAKQIWEDVAQNLLAEMQAQGLINNE